MKRQTKGFTLIELIIAMTVIGVIASLAFPSYVDRIQQERMSEATRALLLWSSRIESNFLNTRNYACILGPQNTSLFQFNCKLTTTNIGYELTATTSSNIDSQRTMQYTLLSDGSRTSAVSENGNVTRNETCWLRTFNSNC